MQKTKINNNTALAIVVIATAVVLIGGLAIIPTATTMQSVSATHGERHGSGGGCGGNFVNGEGVGGSGPDRDCGFLEPGGRGSGGSHGTAHEGCGGGGGGIRFGEPGGSGEGGVDIEEGEDC